jgi:preprotein translocase subunit SecA
MIQMNKNRIRHRWNKIRGVPVEWDLGQQEKILSQINRINLAEVPDKELKKISSRLIGKAQQGIPLDDFLVEAFAVVREAAHRTIGLLAFDVQILAGLTMHQGKLVEMNTGEGKTLAAIFPAYLNALTGKGVHIHTFNDYLARRDTAWMGPVYKFLGLSLGCIQEGMSTAKRKKAYAADITYCTAKEAGFDFLRDQLCYHKEDLVHRDFFLAIVDEADSILIDEARVPLVIAGCTGPPGADSILLAEMVKSLREGFDFETDEGKRNVHLTDLGLKRIENILGCSNLHALENLDLLTKVNQALHAEYLLHRDIDYIVRQGKVEIVDEFTGRVVHDRHWPDGLQAAVESKEKIRRGSEGSILGSITLQHFLGLYPKICGMTATARPAADEFQEFYGLKVVVIPPHRPCIRKDHPHVFFSHKAAKTKALIEEIRREHSSGRPILVGTASVEESEELAEALRRTGISCQVLNAKNDEREAKIVAQAGSLGAVTISTNMAGRGTDIKLGGDQEKEREKVVKLGGLYVIGTNRHESIRIDDQLRGRAGRQGDPGVSRLFISLEDNLIDRYGIRNLLPKHIRSLKQDAPLDDPRVPQETARGQRIIEGQNFEIRKTLWKYTSLVEKQRQSIQQRRQKALLDGAGLDLLRQTESELYAKVLSLQGREMTEKMEKQITLFHIDHCWAEHLAMVADIRESIHLMGVAGKSPLYEFYKIVNSVFLQIDEKIKKRIIKNFKNLPVTKKQIDLAKEGIKGPSSTWTYLINDNQFEEMLKGSNIGFTAAAAAWYGPLFLALKLFQRYYHKGRKTPN